MSYTNGLDNPELYFQTVLYTGDGSTQSITLPGDTNMQPDMVWTKIRNNTFNHYLFDAVRGANKYLKPNQTNAEADGSPDHLTAFDSDGFSLGGTAGVNYDTAPFVSWCWKGGTTSGITTNGSTTITPSAYSFNADAGFAILKYTGNGTAGAKVAHGLGKVPKFIITKRQDEGAESWTTYHAGLGNTKFTALNGGSAAGTATNRWNDTDPDSVNFTLGSEGSVNASSQPLMAYCFADVQGYQKCGKYTGNNNADGVYVHLGFLPAMVIIRATDTSNWYMWDNKRATYNEMNASLSPNQNIAEETSREIDFLSNGFKAREARGSHNDTGEFLYYAVAEAPFVNSNGVPCNAR